MNSANNTETAYRPATLLTSGTHQFAKGTCLHLVMALAQILYCGARDALLKR